MPLTEQQRNIARARLDELNALRETLSNRTDDIAQVINIDEQVPTAFTNPLLLLTELESLISAKAEAIVALLA